MPASPNSQVLPFYIVVDESGSMSGHMSFVNDSLKKLHTSIAGDPVVCDKAMISVITFSDNGLVLVPLTRMDDLTDMPGAKPRGGTSYGAAFRTVKESIDSDIGDLKAQSVKVLRPVVFFISDGVPTDGQSWRQEHATLIDPDNDYHPHILSFGVDQAEETVILEVATEVNRMGHKFAWMAEDGTDPGIALREIIGRLAQTIVASAHQTDGDKVTLIPPIEIPGVRQIGGIPIDPV